MPGFGVDYVDVFRRAAIQLGVTIAQKVLLRADRVIG